MTYKQIPFTLEEWQKDPEGRKIKSLEYESLYVLYKNDMLTIVWNDGDCTRYSRKWAEIHFTLLIPVKTVRKWRNVYSDGLDSNWYSSEEKAKQIMCARCVAILSADFDESGNYIKGSVKVEEV